MNCKWLNRFSLMDSRSRNSWVTRKRLDAKWLRRSAVFIAFPEEGSISAVKGMWGLVKRLLVTVA